MRILVAILAAVTLLGVAPVAVAAGFCAEDSCCPRAENVVVAAPECCGDVVCSAETPDELARTENPNTLAALAPLKSVAAAVVRRPSTPMVVPAPLSAKSGAERLASLSILLI